MVLLVEDCEVVRVVEAVRLNVPVSDVIIVVEVVAA